MKKTVLTAIIAILLAANLFAAIHGETYLDKKVGGFKVNGFINEYCNLTIETTAAVENSAIGVPFDIMGTDIDYNSANPNLGREIAKWSFATNCSSAYITFKATPLVNDTDLSEVFYYLVFRYEYVSEDSSGKPKTVTDFIVVYSNSKDYTTKITNSSEMSSNDKLPIISEDQDVRITLGYNGDAYSTDDKNKWSAGYYNSTVTITLTGGI